jgi:hypothetical protein
VRVSTDGEARVLHHLGMKLTALFAALWTLAA